MQDLRLIIVINRNNYLPSLHTTTLYFIILFVLDTVVSIVWS